MKKVDSLVNPNFTIYSWESRGSDLHGLEHYGKI